MRVIVIFIQHKCVSKGALAYDVVGVIIHYAVTSGWRSHILDVGLPLGKAVKLIIHVFAALTAQTVCKAGKVATLVSGLYISPPLLSFTIVRKPFSSYTFSI